MRGEPRKSEAKGQELFYRKPKRAKRVRPVEKKAIDGSEQARVAQRAKNLECADSLKEKKSGGGLGLQGAGFDTAPARR